MKIFFLLCWVGVVVAFARNPSLHRHKVEIPNGGRPFNSRMTKLPHMLNQKQSRNRRSDPVHTQHDSLPPFRKLLQSPSGGHSHPGPASYTCANFTTLTAPGDGNTEFGVGNGGNEGGRTYDNDLTCVWTIKPQVAVTGLAVIFKQFHIEKLDYVLVYQNSASNPANLVQNLTGEFVTPKTVNVPGAGQVVVKFVSDDSFHSPGTHSAYDPTTFPIGFTAVYLDISAGQCFNSCSGHGTCSNSVCACSEGYVGDDCSVPAPAMVSGVAVPINGLCIGCWGYSSFTLSQTSNVVIELMDKGDPDSDAYLAFNKDSPPTLLDTDGDDWFNWYYDTNDVHVIRRSLPPGKYFIGAANHPARATKPLFASVTVRVAPTGQWECVSDCNGHGKCDKSEGTCVCDPSYLGFQSNMQAFSINTCKFYVDNVASLPLNTEVTGLRVGDWSYRKLDIPAQASQSTLLVSLASHNLKAEPVLLIRKGSVPVLEDGFLPTLDAFQASFADAKGFQLLNGHQQNIVIRPDNLTANSSLYIGVFNLWGHTGLDKESHATANFSLYINDFKAGVPCPRHNDQFCSGEKCDYNTGECACPIHKLGAACGMEAKVLQSSVATNGHISPGESNYFVIDVTQEMIMEKGRNLVFTVTKRVPSGTTSRAYPLLLARKGEVPFQDNYTFWDDHDLTAHFYHDNTHEILLDRDELTPGAWYFSLTNAMESEDELEYTAIAVFSDDVPCPTGNQGGSAVKQETCTGLGQCDRSKGRCVCDKGHTLDDCSGHGLFTLNPNSASTPEQSPDIPVDGWVYYAVAVPCHQQAVRITFTGPEGDKDAAPLLVMRRNRLPLMVEEAVDYLDYFEGASRHAVRQAIQVEGCTRPPCVVSHLWAPGGVRGTRYSTGFLQPGIYFVGLYNDYTLAQKAITNYTVKFEMLGGACSSKHCGEGFKGPSCSLVCQGMFPMEAYSNTPFSNSEPCGGFGNCTATADNANTTCVCDSLHIGAACLGACPAAAAPPSNSSIAPLAPPAACSGRGRCKANSSAAEGSNAAVCECFQAYTGDVCQLGCPGALPASPSSPALACSGHGTCKQSADDDGDPVAVCQCSSGFLGPACSYSCTQDCGEHGKCTLVHTGSNKGQKADYQAVCHCAAGWAGDACNTAIKGDPASTSSSSYATLAVVASLAAVALTGGLAYMYVIAKRRKAELDKWRNPMLSDAEMQQGVAAPSGTVDTANEDHFID